MKKIMRNILFFFEDVAIYISLILLIIMSVLEYIFPNIPLLAASNTYIALFSASLLLLYKKIDSLSTDRKTIKTLDTFSDGLSRVLKNQGKWKSVKIYCHTAYSYFNTIRQTNCVIENLELIVCNDFSNDIFHNRQSEYYLEEINKEYELSISRWPSLVQEGKIKYLKIKYIESIPSFHFAVFDEQSAIFGFLRDAHPSIKLYSYQDFYCNNAHSNLIIDFTHYFDQMFSTAKAIYPSADSVNNTNDIGWGVGN